MTTPTSSTREALVSFLDDRIEILDRNLGEYSPASHVFRTVGVILALVRDEMIDDDDSVKLSDYCFSVCEVLNAAIQEKTKDGLNGSARLGLEDLERIIHEIEQELRARASMPLIEHDRGKIESYKLAVQQTLNALSTPSSSALGNVGMDGPMDVDSADPPTISKPESALRRLIGRKFLLREIPSLIDELFACKDLEDTIRCLPEDDVQAFVDVIDEVLDRPDLPLWVQVKCLRLLYKTCGHHGLLPKALKVPVFYDRDDYPLYQGGYADVWKGECRGREVAVKVIRAYSRSDLRKITKTFCKEVITWKTLQHPNVLPLVGVTMSNAHFAMISEWMTNGNIIEFVKANPDANRLKLLADVARGLIYIHQRGMVHGDLKGANVVIDQTCRARLADFGLLTVVSDSINFFSSSAQAHGGTLRWMSPELIAPEKFGTETSRPTRASDCYSLGMVVYETVSGNIPFHNVPDRAVFLKVVEGEHPSRGVDFTDDLWKMMEQCWMSRPDHRPNVESVLEHLEMCSVGGDLGLGGLILTPAGNPDKLHVCAPLVGTSQDMRGVGSRGVPERPVSGGTPPVVPLDNHPVDTPTVSNVETGSQNASFDLPSVATLPDQTAPPWMSLRRTLEENVFGPFDANETLDEHLTRQKGALVDLHGLEVTRNNRESGLDESESSISDSPGKFRYFGILHIEDLSWVSPTGRCLIQDDMKRRGINLTLESIYGPDRPNNGLTMKIGITITAVHDKPGSKYIGLTYLLDTRYSTDMILFSFTTGMRTRRFRIVSFNPTCFVKSQKYLAAYRFFRVLSDLCLGIPKPTPEDFLNAYIRHHGEDRTTVHGDAVVKLMLRHAKWLVREAEQYVNVQSWKDFARSGTLGAEEWSDVQMDEIK